ncbi:helix-turn-helix domain-containing protein [Methylorubrum thiocyanatum]|uniref:helix-turn-helix domain-containing protein n=1 Tax=Methylorubrum thiocyanatum TaxID=47958 RepID=UPI00383A6660
MLDLAARLGAEIYRTSRPIAFEPISVEKWNGVGLTSANTDFEFRSEAAFESLSILQANRSLLASMRPSKIDLGTELAASIPGEVYRAHVTGPMSCVAVFIAPRVIEATIGVRYTPSLAVENLGRVRQGAVLPPLIRALLEDSRSGSPSGPMLGESVASAIVQLLHPVSIGRMEIAERRAPGLSSRHLDGVRDAIHTRLSESLHLDELAKMTGLSVRQFSRCFRATLGMSPHQYLVRTRVERARELLGRPGQSLDEIAWSAGFADRKHMAAAFAKTLGVPPSHFRHTGNILPSD